MSQHNESSLPPPPSPSGQEKPPSLGVAGNMAKAFIHSPLSPLFFLAMLAMGMLGLAITPRQEDPQISVPMVDIFVRYPGASAEQVASLAIEPLQRIVSEIPAVKHVYAASERGQGMVTVQFVVGEELEKSVFKVHDKLQSHLHQIPPGVSQPMVKPKGVDDVPVVTLTMWSRDVDDGALRTLAFDVLQSIKEIKDTGQGFVVGGRAEQVRVEVMPERLSGFQISLQQVAHTIQTANSEKPAGNVESGNTHFTVYTGSFLRDANDISRLVVGTHNDAPVYVRDVANVFQGPAEVEQIVNFYSGPAYKYKKKSGDDVEQVNGAPAVTIAVAKKVGTNGVSVAEAILDKVENDLKGTLIPDNVHVQISRNYGQTADDKVNGLIKKLFIATGLVTILVLFSLGLRPAVVVTLVIPVVILVTVFSAWVLGFTIDRVSLFALIFSIGILVDDAIVVIENIYRRWLLRGQTDTDTAVDAVREVGNPTILATFTVVAALLPMGFVSGMMGPYMMPIPALGSVAMVVSLFAAFVFTPWWAMALKPSMQQLHKAERKEHAFNEKLEGFFRRLLTPLIEQRTKGWIFLISLVVLFFLAISMFYFKSVEVKMLPLDNKPEFNVFIDMPEGTALPVTANITGQIVEKLREIPEVTALQSYVGTSQPFDFNGMVRHYYLRDKPWQADIHVQLKHKKHRERSSHQLATEARRMIAELTKDMPVETTVVEMPPGPPVLQTIVAEVYGHNDEVRRNVARKMTDIFADAEILDDVDNYLAESHEVWRFDVDTEKAVRRGISVDTINRNLSMAMGDFKVGDVKQGTVLEPTYIVLQVPLNVRANLSRLYDLPIPTMDNRGTVPLAELGRFVKSPQDPIIYHKDLRRIEYVVGDSVGIYLGNNEYRLSSPIYGMFEIEDALKRYTTPDGVNLIEDDSHNMLGLPRRYIGPPETSGQSAFEWTGEWTVTYETFRDMGLAFMAALLLIYVLVVWQFGNFVVPAIIMAPIPLTLLGIVPGHWLFGAYFTATSMIGWIALAGIIVRNSILLVDYSIQEVSQGTPLQDAVILACKTRTRPIMITAFALIFGSMVILFDPIFQGMAISLMFGVLFSTLLTLVVIPLGCMSIGPRALCSGSVDLNQCYFSDEDQTSTQSGKPRKTSFLGTLWGKFIDLLMLVFYLLRAVIMMLFMGLKALAGWAADKTRPQPPAPPPSAPPPPSSGPGGGSGGGQQPPQASPPAREEADAPKAKTPLPDQDAPRESDKSPRQGREDEQASAPVGTEDAEEVGPIPPLAPRSEDPGGDGRTEGEADEDKLDSGKPRRAAKRGIRLKTLPSEEPSDDKGRE